MIGAGFRGREVYGRYAEKNPEKLKFIAVAEPDTARRGLFQQAHRIPESLAFESWEPLLSIAKGQLADAAFICTQDNKHYAPAAAALKAGYHLVLEKPISPNLEECQQISRMAGEADRTVHISHVLRFTEFW